VSLNTLIEDVKAHFVMPPIQEDHVLVIQDTSEFNYNHINGLLKVNDPDIGFLSDNKTTGFLIHPGIAIRASSGIPLGISSVHVWNRPFGSTSKKERNYSRRPIEEKESNKWLLTAQQSKAWLGSKNTMTLIGDRENDIFEYFASVPDQQTDILVRSSWNRKLPSGLFLDEHLEQLSWDKTIDIEIKGNGKRTARTAKLQIKWTEVEITKAEKRKKVLAQYPDCVKLNVVEVLEHPDSVPEGESAVHWRLFTTHEVTTFEEALLMIKWYQWRWFIEDFFRILKTEGLQVESSQFGKGIALKKLVVLCLVEALKILTLRQERLASGDHDADLVFDQEEQRFLELLNTQEQGKTKKQQNPFRPQSLAWAVWIIARIGGWSPSDMNKRPPGVITLSRGLKYFNQRYSGWKTALVYFQDKSNNSP
jgi:hypothetical protein